MANRVKTRAVAMPPPGASNGMPGAAAWGIVVAVGAAFGLHRLMDPDLFQHIAVGRQLIAHPSTIGISTFIDAYPDYAYVEEKWLACVVVAAIDALAGLNGVMLYQIALCVAVASAWYGMQRTWGASRSIAVLGVTLALVVCAFRVEPRPDTASHALLAVVVTLTAARWPRRRTFAATAAVFVLWINVHGYFVNGLLVLLAAAVAAMLGDRSPVARAGLTPRDRLALVAVAVAACFVHPQGWRALASPLQLLTSLRDPALHAGIQEFQPIAELFAGVGTLQGVWLVAPFVIALAIAVARDVPTARLGTAIAALPWLLWPPEGLSVLPYRLEMALWVMAALEIPRCVRERRLLPPMLLLGFTVLAIPVVRNLPLLVPPMLIVLAPGWTEAEALVTSTARARQLAYATVAGVAVAAVWVRLSDRLNAEFVTGPTRTGWGVDADRFPVAATDFIEQARLPGLLLNDFDVGGYLLYRLHPGRRVFINGHTAMYPLSFFNYYSTQVSASPAPDLDELSARYHVQTILWSLVSRGFVGMATVLAANPTWKLVFLDHAAVVFTRAPEVPALDLRPRVAELARREIFHPALPTWLGGIELDHPAMNLPGFLENYGRPDLALVVADALWPHLPSEPLAVLIGTAATQTGTVGTRLPWLDDVQRRYPESADLKTLLFLALADDVNRLLARGDVARSERELERMREIQPQACGPYTGLATIAVIKGNASMARSMVAEAVARDADGTCRRALRGDPRLASLLASP